MTVDYDYGCLDGDGYLVGLDFGTRDCVDASSNSAQQEGERMVKSITPNSII